MFVIFHCHAVLNKVHLEEVLRHVKASKFQCLQLTIYLSNYKLETVAKSCRKRGSLAKNMSYSPVHEFTILCGCKNVKWRLL